MRLLHIPSFELKTFAGPGQDAPHYAILSHTWGDEEVLYEDMAPARLAAAHKKKGFTKVRSACTTAAALGFDHVWIDTLCIDKASSAELSEAINSMFRWYALADVCIAYMADVAVSGGEAAFRGSRWFTRGWTLQELIAPMAVLFYDAEWLQIGTRTSLARPIAALTAISRQLLDGSRTSSRANSVVMGALREILQNQSVAARMSWASWRETSRPEDMAYCLLGIFDVNMPLLYGEGDKAFHRLQEEIARRTVDQSMLAWDQDLCPTFDTVGWFWSGIFAPSPAGFGRGGVIERLPGSRTIYNGGVESEGLGLDLHLCHFSSVSVSYIPFLVGSRLRSFHPTHLVETSELGELHIYLAVLDCCYSRDPLSRPALLLHKIKGTKDRFFRAFSQVYIVDPDSRFLRSGPGPTSETSFQPSIFEVNVERLQRTRIVLCQPPEMLSPFSLEPAPLSISLRDDLKRFQKKSSMCRQITIGALHMPSWPVWGSQMALTLSRDICQDSYNLYGAAWFERTGVNPDADGNSFFVLCGFLSARDETERARYVTVASSWWKEDKMWFCHIVGWERLMGSRCSLAAAASLQEAGSILDTSDGIASRMFRDRLMVYLEESLPGLEVGARHSVELEVGSRVSAEISVREFLGVEGLRLNVAVEYDNPEPLRYEPG